MLDFLSGLLGGGGEGAAPAPQFSEQQLKLAQAYGLPPEIVAETQRQQSMQAMGNIGAILMAAGQPGPMGQRGQMLAQLAGAVPDTNKAMMNAAQMKLYASTIKERDDASARRNQARDMINGMQNLSPELRAMAVADPEAAMRLVAEEQRSLRLDAEKARQGTKIKIEELVSSGVPEPMARGIASGRYVVTKDPVDGTSKVIDISTGMPVGAQPMPTTPVSQQPSPLPTSIPSAPGAAPAPVDYASATGPSGFFQNGVNTITGAVGMNAPYPATEAAVTALNSLKMRTVTEMSAAIPGRDTNQVRQYMESRVVEPASLLTGDSKALSQFTQLRSDIGSEITRLTNLIASGGVKPTEISAVRSNLSNLQALARDYDVVISNFERPKGAQPQGAAPAQSGGQGGAVRRYNLATGRIE